ncbi:MAG: replicative DNA helicase [Candidatus Niyogibacteria bacterium]|nr:replicative DNA helicase [Candidatus Niyogibacteria bacterium]
MAAKKSSQSSLKMPPQNLEAEMSVLGALMLDQKAIIKIVDILTTEDFYYPSHHKVFEAIMDLFKRNNPIDLLSVSTRLKEKNDLEEIGGNSYLAELVNSVPTASNIEHYADIVRKKSVLRNLIEASSHISQLGYQEEEDVDTVLDSAEKKIFSISQRSLRQNFFSVKSALAQAWERIEDLHKNKGKLRGVRTGFKELDGILSGLQKSDLIILAARPSVGKTALALDIARSVAINEKLPVGLFSLEMSIEQLTDRFISAEARVDLHKLRTGRLSEENGDFTNIQHALGKLSGAPIYVDDEGSNTVLQMRAMARRLQAEHGLGLLIIDYLQMIHPQRGVIDNMVQHITEVSRSLKALARELNVPVLALAQLSRAVEMRHPPIPRLADLRDSGSIEQDADVVMFIYREDRYKEDSERKNQADITVAKHRNGPLGKIQLYFNQNIASFNDLENTADYRENF